MGDISTMQLPTVAETMAHPSYPDATWNLKPSRSGLLPVAVGRGGPFKISWEVHGEGPIRVVLINGLGSFKSMWQRQTLYFGHEHHEEFSVLVIDNRGMGDSDKPLLRYSTSEMALDVLEVLDHVGFVDLEPPKKKGKGKKGKKGKKAKKSQQAEEEGDENGENENGQRTVHVVGISMGGMIAQELAYLIPERIASLTLCCTAAAIENTSPTIWENLASRAAMIVPKGVEEGVRGAAGRMLSPAYPGKPDDAALPREGTHLVGPPERFRYPGNPPTTPTTGWYRMFPTNGHRFVAQEMHKRTSPRFSTPGFLLQLIACGWHHKSAEQLGFLAEAVGRERIMLMHGTADLMISVPHGRKLVEYIQPGTTHIMDGMGHAPMFERWRWFNNELEDHFNLGEELAGR